MRVTNGRRFLARHRAAGASRDPRIQAQVEGILRAVRTRGDEALRSLTRRFDRVDLERLEVEKRELRRAWDRTAPAVQRALQASLRNREAFERQLMQTGAVRFEPTPGVRVEARWRPLRRIGCYAPGGRAAYPSTVIMTAGTARIAGVDEVVLASPPGANGLPADPVLAAAHLTKVDRVFALGGAQAIAAFAFGTKTVPRVDKVFGPGNAYVMEAKRLLFGAVGIDSLAGPTELAICADASTPTEWILADLAAQAEHDPACRVFVLTRDRTLAARLRLRAGSDGVGWAGQTETLLCRDDEELLACLERLAPEHVQFLGPEPERLARRARNAGTVFIGRDAPAALGDYATGANHVLPTGGSARWSSPLSVQDFCRLEVRQQVSRKGIRSLAPIVEAIANAEGLPWHAESVRRRLA